MKRLSIVCLVLLAMLFFSCKSTPKKTMANDMCDCFQLAEKSLSIDTKEAIKNAALADDPQQEWDFQVSKLDLLRKAIVKKEINELFIGKNKHNAFNSCMKKVDSGYFAKNTTDQQKKPELRKASEKMKTIKDCDLGYRFMTMMLNLSDGAAKAE